jgi:hypothetical protein
MGQDAAATMEGEGGFHGSVAPFMGSFFMAEPFVWWWRFKKMGSFSCLLNESFLS